MLAKALALRPDTVAYDLEDSVTPAAKPEARAQLRRQLEAMGASRAGPGPEVAVRINAVSTPFALDDLAALAALPALDAVVVPKVNAAADLNLVSHVLRHAAPQRHADDSPNPIKILALIESARAVMDLASISQASPFLSGFIFAAEDFALDLSLTRTPSLLEFLFARSAIVTAARAAGLPSAIDLVCTSYQGDQGLERLREECADGKSLGFNGKQCIHPAQLQTVHDMFAPSQADMDWAARVLVADEKAAASGRGAWTLDGHMIDAPVVGKARAVAAKANRCGFDFSALQTKWSDQEPE